MNIKKGYVLCAIVVCILVAVFASLPAGAQRTRFYACLINKDNTTVNYSVRWCHRNGTDCGQYQNYSLAPGYKREHWADGKARIDVRFHTGGPQGYYRTTTFEGTVEGCQRSSSVTFRRDERGFLRIYD